MNKLKFFKLFAGFLAVVVVVSLASFAVAKAEQSQGQQGQEEVNQNQEQNQGEETMNQEQNQEQEGEPNLIMANCQNQCGDGVCQEVVCQATDCPCAESQNGCPEDCGYKNGKATGQANAQQHRSVVANFVQTLLNAADKEQGGVGEQVRLIAQEQNQAVATTVQAMEKVQTRNKIQTFLFGSDYRNLGVLRSEMVQTRNRIQQLNQVMTSIQNASDTAEIQAQIQEMEQEQTRIENFIQEQEGKFSLFGWLVKLFQ